MSEVAGPAVAFLADAGVQALARLLAACRKAAVSSAAAALSWVLSASPEPVPDKLLADGMIGFALSAFGAAGTPAFATVVDACRAAGGGDPEAQAQRLATLGVAFMLD